MKNTYFRRSDQYDNGKRPNIAANVHGQVIEVHESDGTLFNLWSHAGKIDDKTINSVVCGKHIVFPNSSFKYDNGKTPACALNDQGIAVEIHQSENRFSPCLCYHISNYEEIQGHKWRDSHGLHNGEAPDIALSNQINHYSIVVAVYKDGAKLFYSMGTIKGTEQQVEWIDEKKEYTGSGNNPSIAIRRNFNNNMTYAVGAYEAGGVIYAHLWELKFNNNNKAEVIFKARDIFVAQGTFPSVDISNEGEIVILFRQAERLYSHTGKIDYTNDNIIWNTERYVTFESGIDPSVAIAGDYVVQIHRSEVLQHLYYSIGEFIEKQPVWMKQIKDDRNICSINLPGTHDTCTFTSGVPGVRTQNHDLMSQLEMGVRFIDIRCRHFHNIFTIHHGDFFLGMDFRSVMFTCLSFLKQNPTETILMVIKEEHTSEGCTRSFEETFRSEYFDNIKDKWLVKNSIPTLGEARGKIVLLRRFPLAQSNTLGLDLSDWKDDCIFETKSVKAKIQDNYKANRDEKLGKVNLIIDEAIDKNHDYLYLNFSSIQGAPEAYASFLNPRVNEKINSSRGRFGVIAMDFINPIYAHDIICTNFKK